MPLLLILILLINSSCSLPNNKSIIFVRHGETEWNPSMIPLGELDLSLNDRGKSQASEIGNLLFQKLKDHKIIMLVSPRQRTIETAEIILNYLNENNVTPILSSSLMERSYHEPYFTTDKEFEIQIKEAIKLIESQNIYNKQIVVISHKLVIRELTKHYCGAAIDLDFGKNVDCH